MEPQSLMDQIEEIKKKAKEGEDNTKWRFCFGVMYAFFACWAFGAIPQHFWILYFVSFIFLVVLDWEQLCKSNSQGSFKEFCWYANFMGIFLTMSCGVLALESHWRHTVFSMAWATATGVLAFMSIASGNQLTFSHVPTFGETFIHVFPTLVMYTIRWQREVVAKAYPSLFHVHVATITSADIFKGMIFTYMPWWTLYLIWAIKRGVRRRGATDFFSENMERVRKHAGCLRKLYTSPDSPPVAGDVIILMSVHAVYVLSLTVVAVLAFYHRNFHRVLNLVVVGRVVQLGSMRLAKMTSYYEAVKACERQLAPISPAVSSVSAQDLLPDSTP